MENFLRLLYLVAVVICIFLAIRLARLGYKFCKIYLKEPELPEFRREPVFIFDRPIQDKSFRESQFTKICDPVAAVRSKNFTKDEDPYLEKTIDEFYEGNYGNLELGAACPVHGHFPPRDSIRGRHY